MRLEVHFSTTYTYSPPVGSGLTVVRVRPRSRPGLVVESSVLHVAPGVVSASYTDSWGTHADIVEFARPHESARYTMHAVVRSEPDERPAVLPADEAAIYCQDSARVRTAAVESLGWHVGEEGSSWSAIESVLAWIPQRFSYRIGVTDALTEVERVVELGVGVCQDFSHILLAIVRGWGWAARYVCGYVFTAGGGDTIEAEAMHAWVEVWRPGFGWVGMDPTTGRFADERYIVVGCGRDYEDVRPVRGVLHGRVQQQQSARLRIGLAAGHVQLQQQ